MKYGIYRSVKRNQLIAVGPYDNSHPLDVSVILDNETYTLERNYNFGSKKQKEQLKTMLSNQHVKIVDTSEVD